MAAHSSEGSAASRKIKVEPKDGQKSVKVPLSTVSVKEKEFTGKDEAKFKKFLTTRDDHLIIDPNWPSLRIQLAERILTTRFDAVMGMIILSHFFCAMHEVDLAAKNERIPTSMQIAMVGFLLLYTIELSARVYVLQWKFLNSKINLLDIITVAADACVLVLETVVGSMPSVAVFRIFRLVRLLRAFRVLTTFRELYIMVHSFLGAMKAIMWCMLMIFVVLTIWSMVAVEFLHPINTKLAEEGVFEGCERCGRAYESVMASNLTLFQQIVAGDSWGMITIPMIEHYPATLLFYIPTFVTVGMGLLNLVLSVIVDRAEAARQANEQEKLSLKLMAVKLIFSSMDDDSSGDVSLNEFLEGLESQPEMHHALDLLGVRVADLSTVFEMMDHDGSGTVSCDEFVENLTKMKNEESFMILLYVKHFMQAMQAHIELHMEKMQGGIDQHVDALKDEIFQTRQTVVGTNGIVLPDLCEPSSKISDGKPVPPKTDYALSQPSIGVIKSQLESLCTKTESNLASMLQDHSEKLNFHAAQHRRNGDVLTTNMSGATDQTLTRTTPGSSQWGVMCGDILKGRPDRKEAVPVEFGGAMRGVNYISANGNYNASG